MRLKTLRVIPNPWLLIHVYADGVPRPVCGVHVDMAEHVNAPQRMVGARIVDTKLLVSAAEMRIGSRTVTKRAAQHENYWEFATEAVEIPNTPYYRDNLRQRTLLPCDAAIAEWNANYGPRAFEDAQPRATEPTNTEPASAEPTESKPEKPPRKKD